MVTQIENVRRASNRNFRKSAPEKAFVISLVLTKLSTGPSLNSIEKKAFSFWFLLRGLSLMVGIYMFLPEID